MNSNVYFLSRNKALIKNIFVAIEDTINNIISCLPLPYNAEIDNFSHKAPKEEKNLLIK